MSLSETVKQLINTNGWIAIDDLMRLVMSDHSMSYYKKPGCLGEAGDFITSPEISQLFGEVIGIWCLMQWQKLGKPQDIGLVELGPGRALLMRDLLNTVKKISPEFYKALHVQLFDINPYLIEEQKRRLAVFDCRIKWLQKLYHINKMPTIFVANEFFDALPIKQYIKINNIWNEIVAVISSDDNQMEFSNIQISLELNGQITKLYNRAREGGIYEVSNTAQECVYFICNHIKSFGGMSLIIDYGYNISPAERRYTQYNSTLQAIKNHQYHKLLHDLGSADWSAHVDFNALSQISQELAMKIMFSTQSQFLKQYGIIFRADMLKRHLREEQRGIIDRQVDYLLSQNKMGTLFKVLEFASI